MPIMKTAVLAYSGRLDTSVCIPLLSGRYDCDQEITAVADRSALHKYAKHYTQSTSMELKEDMNDTSLCLTHKER
jgi:argininosuccinate synthase